MADIAFYHLMRMPLDQALPKLLGRVLSTGGRALLLAGSEERVAALDTALWVSQDPDWLPHGTKASGHAAMQPIWLTTEDEPAPNGARFLVLVDGAESRRMAEYDRVLDLFDGQDPEAVAAARRRWSAAKAAGHGLSYWQQGDRGWEKKA